MSVDVGLLILRVVVGLLLAGHGAQKLFGWFGGYGLEGTAGWLGSLGFRPARLWAFLAGLAELGGGLLLALGFLTPLGSLGIMASMLMAMAKVHWPRVWVTENGIEHPLVNAAVAFVLGLLGPGVYALDAALGTSLPLPISFWVGLALVVLGVFVAFLISAAPPAQQETGKERTDRAA